MLGLETKLCPECGAPIRADAPESLCIPCVLALAQEERAPASIRSGAFSNSPRRRLGDYELIREIGRGGMGVVFVARHARLDRQVALKIILAGEFASETTVARFKDEAEVIARLDHPNIVPIYEVGEFEGHHFFAMKLIEGGSLAGRIAGKPLPGKHLLGSGDGEAAGIRPAGPQLGAGSFAPNGKMVGSREAVQLLVKVARALHFVHQRGVIHRDLSPENILLDPAGEPVIADFGLARFHEDRQLTRTLTIVGKPDYMSPEQADPASPEITTASDIFSLGAIFYELLTGCRPFAALSPFATLERVRNSPPRAPSSLNRTVTRDLETICLKCLAKQPAGRYESAAALADDLERWLLGEPILARPVGALERGWKWVLRQPLKAALLLAAVFAVTAPLFVAFYFNDYIVPEAARAHPIVGLDRNIRGFSLTFDTNRVDRATMNFDTFAFRERSRKSLLCFTNIPPECLPWISNLQCQVIADIPIARDPPRSPVVRHGATFVIDQRQRRDRAFYVKPFGWKGEDVLARAPNARLCIILLDGD